MAKGFWFDLYPEEYKEEYKNNINNKTKKK